MEASIITRAMTTVVAAVMACTLGATTLAPRSALAEETDAILTTQDEGTDEALLSTQSSKKTVYLRSKIGKAKYFYNSNGLVTKIKGGAYTWTYKYSGTKIVSAVRTSSSNTTKTTYTYDSKGRMKKIKTEGYSTETLYYNGKNQVKKSVCTYTSNNPTETSKYHYNSKGLVTKIDSTSQVTGYSYDSKGNQKSWYTYHKGRYLWSHSLSYENTYRKGRLSKVRIWGRAVDRTEKISYTTKKLSRKYAAAAKAQQKALRVYTPNSALPWSV